MKIGFLNESSAASNGWWNHETTGLKAKYHRKTGRWRGSQRKRLLLCLHWTIIKSVYRSTHPVTGRSPDTWRSIAIRSIHLIHWVADKRLVGWTPDLEFMYVLYVQKSVWTRVSKHAVQSAHSSPVNPLILINCRIIRLRKSVISNDASNRPIFWIRKIESYVFSAEQHWCCYKFWSCSIKTASRLMQLLDVTKLGLKKQNRSILWFCLLFKWWINEPWSFPKRI